MTHYIGSGPYCYANSLAMTLGASAPPPAVIEVLTGSPFGFELLGGTLPLFDPYGWDPDHGLDAAIALLGTRCTRTAGGTAREAEERLRAAVARGPAVVGPVDMGLLLHQPGTPSADGGDHFVPVPAVDGDTVVFHDPHGHPHATLPVAAFLAAWEAKAFGCTDAPYVMRSGFVQERPVSAADALRASLPVAEQWLAGRFRPGRPARHARWCRRGEGAGPARGAGARRAGTRLPGVLRDPGRCPPGVRRRPLPGLAGS